MKKILHVVNIDAPRKKVFDAVTTETGLTSWWSTKVSAEERQGGEVRFTFRGDFNPVMKIASLDEPRFLEWECVSGHEPWQKNTFGFQLKELEDGRTQLLFTQDYARELSDEAYGTYNFNWGYYLESLKEYCEIGEGKPFEAT